jgi:hypothetical protein
VSDSAFLGDRPLARTGVLFLLKMAAGVVWLAGAAWGGAYLSKGGDALPLKALAAAAVVLPVFVWIAVLRRQAAIDELEERLALMAQAQGGWWALAYGSTLFVISSLMGDGVSPVMLATLPAGGFLFGEAMAQVARFNLSRPGKERRA